MMFVYYKWRDVFDKYVIIVVRDANRYRQLFRRRLNGMVFRFNQHWPAVRSIRMGLGREAKSPVIRSEQNVRRIPSSLGTVPRHGNGYGYGANAADQVASSPVSTETENS